MKVESWVTLVECDRQGWEALVLAKSLKRTFTSKNLTVIITEKVSQPMKIFLQDEFDHVLKTDNLEMQLKTETIRKDLSILWCWNLKTYTKCVFLDSNSIVLQNSDSLFDHDELSACPSEKSDRFNSSLFIFKPNTETFEKLIQTLKNDKSGSSADILNKYFKNWISTPRNHTDEMFCKTLDQLETDDGSVVPNILFFDGKAWEINKKKYQNDTAAKLAGKWIQTFLHEVLPAVNKEKCEKIYKSLVSSILEHKLPSANAPLEPLSDVNLGELKDAIAIVGMSCRFPGANNAEEYWNLLAEGRNPIRPFPVERSELLGKNTADGFEAGFLKCRVDEFDAKFFGISPREAPFVDPQQRILLEVIWESLETANINPQTLRGTDTGVFMGVWQQDYDRLLPNFGLSANEFHCILKTQRRRRLSPRRPFAHRRGQKYHHRNEKNG